MCWEWCWIAKGGCLLIRVIRKPNIVLKWIDNACVKKFIESRMANSIRVCTWRLIFSPWNTLAIDCVIWKSLIRHVLEAPNGGDSIPYRGRPGLSLYGGKPPFLVATLYFVGTLIKIKTLSLGENPTELIHNCEKVSSAFYVYYVQSYTIHYFKFAFCRSFPLCSTRFEITFTR